MGLSVLGLCTLLLVISSYVGFEMWYISLSFALALVLFVLVYSLIKKRNPTEIKRTFFRCSWELIPFILSMFVIVLALNEHGITKWLGENLSANNMIILSYGCSSFLFANFINNIPMSVLFSSASLYVPTGLQMQALYASIIGSNIGAYFTPVGVLAGIMWLSILKKYQVNFSFFDFIKYGIIIAIPTLLSSLGGLYLSFLFI